MKKKLMSGFLAFCMLSAMAPGALAVDDKDVNGDNHTSFPSTSVCTDDVHTGTKVGELKGKVIWANMVDSQSGTALIPAANTSLKDLKLITSPSITVDKVEDLANAGYSGYNEVYKVTLTGTDAVRHNSGAGDGTWVGIGVPIPELDSTKEEANYIFAYGDSTKELDEDLDTKFKIQASNAGSGNKWATTLTNKYPNEGTATHLTAYWNTEWAQSKYNIPEGSRVPNADGKHGIVIMKVSPKPANTAADKYTLYEVDFSGVTNKTAGVSVVDSDMLTVDTGNEADPTKIDFMSDVTDLKLTLSVKDGADGKLPETINKITATAQDGTAVSFYSTDKSSSDTSQKGTFTYNKSTGVIKFALLDPPVTPPVCIAGDMTIDAFATKEYTVSVENENLQIATGTDAGTADTNGDYKIDRGTVLNDKKIVLEVSKVGGTNAAFVPSKLDSIKIGETVLKEGKDGDYTYAVAGDQGTITFNKAADEESPLYATGNIVIEATVDKKVYAQVDTASGLTISVDGNAADDQTLTVGTPFTELKLKIAAKATTDRVPASIKEIKMGETPLVEGTDFDYNHMTGEIAFKGDKKVDGIISVNATAEKKPAEGTVYAIQFKDSNQNAFLSITPYEVKPGEVVKEIKLAVQPSAVAGSGLPTDITSIVMKGQTDKTLAKGTEWSYNAATGVIKIIPEAGLTVTGNLEITATAMDQAAVELKDETGNLEITPLAVEAGGTLGRTTLTLSVKEGVTAFGLPEQITIKTKSGDKETEVLSSNYKYDSTTGVITFNQNATTSVAKGDVLIVYANARDTEPPVLNRASKDTATKTDFEVFFTSTEDATTWHALIQDAEKETEAPTAADVKASTLTGTIAKGGDLASVKSADDTALTVEAGKKYKVWILGTDEAGNDSKELLCIDVTTEAKNAEATITKFNGEAITWDGTKATVEIDPTVKSSITAADFEASAGATLELIGGEVTLASGDKKEVSILVTAEDGTKATYTLTVTCPAAVETKPEVVGDVVKAEVDENTADLVDKAAENGLVINAATVDDEDTQGTEVNIPTTVVDKIAETKDKENPVDTTIKTPKVEITVPAEVMSTAAEALKNDSAAAGKKLKLSVRKTNEGKPASSKGSSYDIKFTYDGADKDHAIDVTTTKSIKLDFARNWNLHPSRENPILMVWYNPKGTTPEEKYVIQKRITDDNTKSIGIEMNHLSVYSQITMEDLKELGVEISGNSSLTLQQDENGMYYAKDAEKGHWLYFVLNAEDGTGRVQTGMGEVKYEAEDVPFAPMYEGTLNVFELSGVPKFTNGVFQEEGNKLYDNGLGDAVKPMN